MYAWSKVPDTSTILDADVTQTLMLKANYLANVRHAKNNLIMRADCPDCPDAVWADVLLNQYIDFDHVYAGHYMLNLDTCHTQSIGDVYIMVNHTSSGLKRNKLICTHGEWAITFAATKAVVLFAYPHHAKEFSEYEKFIIGQFAAFVDVSQHSCITMLD